MWVTGGGVEVYSGIGVEGLFPLTVAGTTFCDVKGEFWLEEGVPARKGALQAKVKSKTMTNNQVNNLNE